MSGDDIDVLSALHDLVAFQPQPPVGRTFAGLEIVFVAVPWADEVHLVGESLPVPGSVGTEYVLDLVHDDAFAGRPTLMNAEILVGVERALPVKHADLFARMFDDTALAV